MTPREALLAAAKGRAPDDVVPVAAGWILAALADGKIGDTTVDLSATKVAELLGRDRVTVTSWCRSGLLPGAYKLRGRSWRVPAASLAAFQRSEAARADAT